MEFEDVAGKEDNNKSPQSQGVSLEEAEKGIERFRNHFFEHRFIPPQQLGKILEIYSYFLYFDELLEGPEFELEELWACFQYNGNDFLELVHDLHTVIIYVFLENLKTNVQKFEYFSQQQGSSIFFIIYQMSINKSLRKLLLGLIWPDLASEIIQIFNSKVKQKEEVLKILKDLDILKYN